MPSDLVRSLARRLAWGIACLLAAFAPPAARAGFVETSTCRLGKIPATSLTLPYFELDTRKKKTDTNVVVSNATAAPLIASVRLFSDLGVQVLYSELYLTGYDVERLSLRELLYAPPAAQPGVGAYTTLCSAEPVAVPDEACLEQLRAALRGAPVEALAGQCVGFPHGDTFLRGWARIDLEEGGETANSLWGEFEIVEKKRSFGGNLVHVRQSELLPTGSIWSLAYRGGIPELATKKDPRTDAIVYRELPPAAPFDCAAPPDGAGQAQVVAFDDFEEAVELDSGRRWFPLVTQRVRVGSADLPLPFASGWIFLNLDDGSQERAWVGAVVTRKKNAFLVEGGQSCE